MAKTVDYTTYANSKIRKSNVKKFVDDHAIEIIASVFGLGCVAFGFYIGHKSGFNKGAVAVMDGIYEATLANGGGFFRKYTRRNDPKKAMYLLAEEATFSANKGCLHEVFNDAGAYLKVVKKEAK